MTPRVMVQYGTRRPWAPGVPSLRRWAVAALAAGPPGTGVGIRVVDAREGRRLNRGFRGKDAPTNVLSFVAPPAPAGAGGFIGDQVICAPVVAREAQAQHKPLAAHWAHMVVHGTLHLLGYDHQRPRAARTMEAREKAILADLGYQDPYEDG